MVTGQTWIRAKALHPAYVGKKYLIVREATSFERLELFEPGTGPWIKVTADEGETSQWALLSAGVIV